MMMHGPANVNPLNAELIPICCLLALLGAYHFLHVSRIRVKSLTLRLLMSYIYDISSLRVKFHMTSYMKITLAVLELFHVSSWRDGRKKEEFYKLFAGIKAHLEIFSYKISNDVYESEKTLCFLEKQSTLKCYFNYNP
jgi:hypothetical protein